MTEKEQKQQKEERERRERLLRNYNALSVSGRAKVRIFAADVLEIEELEDGLKTRRQREEKKKAGDKNYCAFCGRLQAEVPELIAGPTVNICSDCIAKCNEVLAEVE